MSLLLVLTPEGPQIHGSAPSPAYQSRTPPNGGQGDSRKRIVPVVKAPAAPSVEVWEGGAFVTLQEQLESKPSASGVLLQPADDPFLLIDALEGVALLAIDIHRINDGRAYSLARLIRDRIGYRGPLRAVGAVTADQIFALAGVGFDQFLLRADQEVSAALAALNSFTFTYHQGLASGPDTMRREAAERAQIRLALLRPEAQVAGAAL